MTVPCPLLRIIRPAVRLIWVALMIPACGLSQENLPMPPEAPQAQFAVRLATFNVALGMSQQGELSAALRLRSNPSLRALAEIVQIVRPDILVLNEFDYDPAIEAASLLNQNYLGTSQNGHVAIDYPFHFRAEVNTGIDSGLDLDGDGELGAPEDAWGFGRFPGQYGMLVLSRFPIDAPAVRTFQKFRWSDLPGAHRPVNPDGSNYYPDDTWQKLRLSSKSHWDLSIDVHGKPLHLLVFHPTPPVFDGPEDRNGWRNFDEIRFWAEYLSPASAGLITDDQGRRGGLVMDQRFVIAGDFNADPYDGDSRPGAIAQLLSHPRVNSHCIPVSEGAREAALSQAGRNRLQQGDPAVDTTDFNDAHTGNLRLDYLLPSVDLAVTGCGVFWPAVGQAGRELIGFSDHRLVWLDITG